MAKPDIKSIPEFAIVVPVRNEVESVGPLIDEIIIAFNERRYEVIIIDDGSDDGTGDILADLEMRHQSLHIITHNCAKGQSTAIVSGIRAAKATIIITMDGDGQNDPADAPKLLNRFIELGGGDHIMIVGHRINRRDTLLKRFASKVANVVRSNLLKDATPDTGCGLKVFSRQAFIEMPAFDHMHRFLPALMIRAGGKVLSIPVNHRIRAYGVSKYGLWNRLWVGIIDLLGMMWLTRRTTNVKPQKVGSTQGKKI
ncbi:MAG: dolichol-phosphate mannosyltransferase [Magnetovibrio sp.]|nr:dolichol-phosphate mannosyltransferase [Magnetovibrio sp.]